MLERVPRAVGKSFKGARAGLHKLLYYSDGMTEIPEAVIVTSPAFAEDSAIPARFTADGEEISPPLDWRGVPPGTANLVLLVEDLDAPSPEPLVHCIAWNLPARDGGLAEGDLPSRGAKARCRHLGRNSFLRAQYLPPDPPPGHGPHHYAFQLYALDRPLAIHGAPGRGALADALPGHVLAKGMLIGTYRRD